MQAIRLAFMAMVVAMLSGCAADSAVRMNGSAPRTLTLSAADLDGVLIVGMPRGARKVNTLVFHSYDPVSNLLISPEKGGQVFELSGGGTLFDVVDTVGRVQYILQRIPLGSYYLTTVYWGPYGRTLLTEGSVAVEVQSGTARYVGNLEFRTPVLIFQDVTIRLGSRHDSAARSFLAKYPGIAVEMQNQTLQIFKLNCVLDDGIKACYAP